MILSFEMTFLKGAMICYVCFKGGYYIQPNHTFWWYILPTHLKLGYHKACIQCCELRFYGCVPWYFFLPIVTLKVHNLCFKRHGSSTAWGAPNRNKLSTAGNHWFPLVPMQCWCKLILHRLPRCCVRDFPSRTEKAGCPTIDKFPSAAWPFERRFIFCFAVWLFWCGDDPS